jgi:hypothetical protein
MTSTSGVQTFGPGGMWRPPAATAVTRPAPEVPEVPSGQLLLTEHVLAAIADGRLYYCGRCNSLIPQSHWHTCDDDRTHTARQDLR